MESWVNTFESLSAINRIGEFEFGDVHFGFDSLS